jgi:tRNA G18 (ribose-2'-O)-methylase SpoU
MRKLKNSELNRKSIGQYRESDKSPFVIVLDNVRSNSNVGSVFRTADAFLVEKIFLCGITGTPPHKEIRKTALGATESVEWVYYKTTYEAIQNLKEQGYVITGVEQADRSVSLNDLRFFRIALCACFWHEVNGVDKDHMIYVIMSR